MDSTNLVLGVVLLFLFTLMVVTTISLHSQMNECHDFGGKMSGNLCIKSNLAYIVVVVEGSLFKYQIVAYATKEDLNGK